MTWDDDRTAALARGLSAEDRRALQEAIRQADSAVASRQSERLDHGRWINVRPDPIDFRDCLYQPGFIALAPRLDPPPELAQVPIREQKYLSSCTGMALATAIDILRGRTWLLAGGDTEPPPPVSGRMLYEMGRPFDEHPDDGLPGSSVRGVLRGFFHNGVCREIDDLDNPLNVGPQDWEFTIDRAKDARHCTLGVYARLHHILLDYHCALNEIGVIVVSLKAHAGWRIDSTLDREDPQERWRIRWDRSQPMIGGHAVVIVGYDEQGFLIRNSWGEHWSCWQDKYAGVAHWSYDDWQNNVMDGWVIQLGVAGSHDARAVGGSFTTSAVSASPSRGSPPRLLVNGHYLNVKDGRLVSNGTYHCSQQSMVETAGLLRSSHDYDHLLVAVESGLDAFDTMVERALLLIPHLKSARIYPFFVWWHDGSFELASELLEDRARRLAPRTGGVPQLGTRLLETFAREFMQPFWRTFEGEAERSFTLEDPRRGQAWVALRTLFGAARAHAPPLRIHAVAHGTGAVWLGELCRRLVDERTITKDWPGPAALAGLFSTVSLLAPICAPALFDDPEMLSLWADGQQARLGIYTLSEEDEDNDCVGAFHGSFLRLAQKVFPIAGRVPDEDRESNRVLGDASVARRIGRRKDAQWLPIHGRAVGSTCRTHRALAADLRVLQHLLSRVLADPGGQPRPINLPLAGLP